MAELEGCVVLNDGRKYVLTRVLVVVDTLIPVVGHVEESVALQHRRGTRMVGIATVGQLRVVLARQLLHMQLVRVGVDVCHHGHTVVVDELHVARGVVAVGVVDGRGDARAVVIARLVVDVRDVRGVGLQVVEDIFRILTLFKIQTAECEEALHRVEVIDDIQQLNGTDECGVCLLCAVGGEAAVARHERTEHA